MVSSTTSKEAPNLTAPFVLHSLSIEQSSPIVHEVATRQSWWVDKDPRLAKFEPTETNVPVVTSSCTEQLDPIVTVFLTVKLLDKLEVPITERTDPNDA